MFIVLVSVHVKPEYVEAFRQATIENSSNSVHEPGIAQFDFLQQSDDPSSFMLYEVYRSPDAPAQHRETAHYKNWLAKVTDMMAEPRTRLTYGNVFPADQDW